MEIARNNGLSPAALYARIEPQTTHTGEASRGDTQRVMDRYDGKGIGRRTLADLCTETGVDVTVAKRRLAEQSIAATQDDTLEAIAESANRHRSMYSRSCWSARLYATSVRSSWRD